MERVIIVKVLVYNAKGELLLVRRSETAPRRALEWDFPGGFVDETDESFQHAARRETEEETSLRIMRGQVHLAFTDSEIHEFGDTVKDVSWLYFEATAESEDVTLSYEHDQSAWVPLAKAQQMIKYDKQLRALNYVQRRNELRAT
jgi:8-oxo-dGTP pyrophosphatase MutT (NUDIX family)